MKHRTLEHYTRESRFAISDQDAETEALFRIKENSKPEMVRLIQGICATAFLTFEENEIKISAKALYKEIFGETPTRYTSSDVINALKREFSLEPSETARYFKTPQARSDGRRAGG